MSTEHASANEAPTVACVVYAARSQAEEPGKDSTGDQAKLIRERIAREGGRFVHGEPYVDHASGYRGDRGPGLEAAMACAVELATTHETVELWVWISSRLGRGSGLKGEARSVLEVFTYLRRHGVTLRSVEDDQFVTSPMLVGFAAEQAEKYSRDLAANVTRGITSRALGGKPWGPAGYPFRKTEDGDWEPVPHEVPTYVRIFTERARFARSVNGIAAALANDGVPTRNGARAWSPAVVSKVLAGREGLGYFKHRGEWIRGRHEPIISEELWRAAQDAGERSRKYAPGGRSGRLPKAHVFVRGALRCGLCGEAMLPRSARDQADTYACRTHKLDSARCPMPILRRADVDGAALRLFGRVALSVEQTRDHVAAQLDARIAEARAQASRATSEAAELRAQTARLDRDYRRGALSAENHARLSADVAGELAAAEAEAERLAAHAESTAATLAGLDAEGEALNRLALLRAAIAKRVSDAASAGDVGALRAAMSAVFSAAHIVPKGTLYAQDEDADLVLKEEVAATPLYVVPELRPEMLLPDELGWSVLQRVAVAFDAPPNAAANKCSGSGVPL